MLLFLCIGFFQTDLVAIEKLYDQEAYGQAYQALGAISQPEANTEEWEKWAFLKGSCALELGNKEEALTLLEALYKKMENPSHHLLHNYARALYENKNLEQALSMAQKALAARENSPADERLKTMHLVAQCHRQNGQMEEAIQILDKAVVVAQKSFDAGHQQIARELLLRFSFVLDAKKLERAKVESQVLHGLATDEKHPLRLPILEQLGEYAYRIEDYHGSFQYFETALGLLESQDAPELKKRVNLKVKLCEAAFRMDESWRCESQFREMIDLLGAAGMPKSRQVGIAYYGLGRIYTQWNNHDDARKAFQEAQKIFFLIQDQKMILEVAKYLKP